MLFNPSLGVIYLWLFALRSGQVFPGFYDDRLALPIGQDRQFTRERTASLPGTGHLVSGQLPIGGETRLPTASALTSHSREDTSSRWAWGFGDRSGHPPGLQDLSRYRPTWLK